MIWQVIELFIEPLQKNDALLGKVILKNDKLINKVNSNKSTK